MRGLRGFRRQSRTTSASCKSADKRESYTVEVDEKPAEITALLNLAQSGDDTARGEVFGLIYNELRRLARSQRRYRRGDETMNTTALVHEAYVRLAKDGDTEWQGRRHFFATAAKAMRSILVDEARRKGSTKRGGDMVRVEIPDQPSSPEMLPEEVVALDKALTKLEQDHPEDFEVAMLRYFTGLSAVEVGDLLEQSARTIQRRWKFCRSYLSHEFNK